jgi:integrase
MAHILARKMKSGMRYTANIRITKNGAPVHRESKTFGLRTAAENWARAREVELEEPTAMIRAKHGRPSLASLIRWYIDEFKPVANWQRTKQSHLEFLERHPIGQCDALELTSAMLMDHVRSRRADGAGPATVANDLTWISSVLEAARSVNEVPVNPEIVQEARTACRELRLVKKSRKRARRPTSQELDALFDFFARRDRRSELPMCDILEFAIESARRESEITSIEWADLDVQSCSGMVRDAKHPREKDGNHRRFKCTPEAWAIIQRQPRTSEYIFPFNSRSIQAAFTRACKILGIEDLRFHDNRHEGTSRLFERGYRIHEVAQFTLHNSWNELKRYTNLRPENVRAISASHLRLVRQVSQGVASVTAIAPARAARQSIQQDPLHSPTMVTSGHGA